MYSLTIFGIPLILFLLFSMSIYFCIKKCKVQYDEIKDTYPDPDDLEPVKETNNGDILPNQCPICFLFMGEFKELSCCNKTLCKKCFNQVEICPFCRGNFNKNKPKIIKISL